MTETILVAGTASHVGKSTIAAGLCRSFARRGISVAPFKAQNMSNNARVAVSPEGGWGEIGVSQHVQARAAEIVPTTDVNPVLLKPRGDGESQLVIQGEAVGHFGAGAFYDDHWDRAREAVEASYRRLAADHDVIVAEGAGSIAEINLHDRDLANVETTEIADAKVLLVVDIERGGAFASLYGTIELVPDRIRDRIVGAVINKFRGDETVLEPGIEAIETETGVPILGVVPFDDPGLPEEDSVSLPTAETTATVGEDDVPDARTVEIAVPRLPRISNFTDLEPLADEPGVRVVYVPLDASIESFDAVVLPGSKNTVDDLLAIREAGFDDRLRAFDGPVVGLCGGYQMLGERITGAGVESTRDLESVEAIGLLPVKTHFSTDKRVERVTRSVEGVGPIVGAEGTATGYEIHMGRSRPTRPVDRPIGPESAATDRVLGTYLHGLFENDTVREAFLEFVFASVGVPRPTDRERVGGAPPGSDEPTDRSPTVSDEPVDRSPYDRAAELVENHVDLSGHSLSWDECANNEY